MTMQFVFYPGHENGCGHPRDCPHLGGASVGHLVHIVNTSEDSQLYVHRELDAQRKRNSELVTEVLRLEKALEQAQLELRLEDFCVRCCAKSKCTRIFHRLLKTKIVFTVAELNSYTPFICQRA